MGEEVKTDVGVMKSETRQLDADSIWDTGQCFLSRPHTCGWQVWWIGLRVEWAQGGAKCEPNCMYCMKVYDAVDNWIIKANLTKARAPPPAERGCQRSVTSSIYVHWSLWWGWGIFLKALYHQLLYLSFPCRKRKTYFILFCLNQSSIHFSSFNCIYSVW